MIRTHRPRVALRLPAKESVALGAVTARSIAEGLNRIREFRQRRIGPGRDFNPSSKCAECKILKRLPVR